MDLICRNIKHMSMKPIKKDHHPANEEIMANRSLDSRQSDTKLRIKDTAERLFARNGFQRTSIKRLASEARVNLAAVNYHFGSKMTLIERVVERRWRPVNQQHMERLEVIRRNADLKDGGFLDRKCLRSLIEPAFTSDMPKV